MHLKSFIALFMLSVIVPGAMADDVFGVPFVDDFDQNTKRELFTTIDANGDGVTFKRHYTTSIFPGFFPDTDHKEMEYDSGAAREDADDWFITPKIHLQAGKVYSFAYNAYVSFDSYVQRMQILMGQGTTVEAMTQQVSRMTTINSSSPSTFEYEFTVEADGDYNFGMHVTSEADRGSLYFTHIVVKQTSSDDVPSQIADLNVEAAEKGALSATVSFTAPTQTLAGDALTDITKVEISRNGDLITTLKDITPGQMVTYTDNGPQNGYNNYSAVAYNAKGKGIKASLDSIYVGVDIPLMPTNFKVIDHLDEAELSWSHVDYVGERGYYVDPNSVIYVVQSLSSDYTPIRELTFTNDTSYIYNLNTQSGSQDLQRFGVRCYNTAGWSEMAYARIVVGKPYNLPYRESFATGTNHGMAWQEGIGTYNITTRDAADGDAGCAMYVPRSDGEEVSFNLGKISMRQVIHPVMRFSYKGLTAGDQIRLVAMRQDGSLQDLTTLAGETPEWTTVTVDLAALAGEAYIIPKFMTRGTTGCAISLDDIQIMDLYDCDLSLQIEAEVDEESMLKATLTVTNEGMEEVEAYDILVSIDGEQMQRIEATEPLLPGQTKTETIELLLQAEAETSVEVEARVTCLYDLNPDNDAAWVQVVTPRPQLAGNGQTTNITLVREHNTMDIYGIDGRLVRRAGEGLEGLKAGIYIIGKKKVCVRH